MSKNTSGDSASTGRHIINFTGKVKFILYASPVSITALGVDKQILSHSSSSQISGTRTPHKRIVVGVLSDMGV